MEPHRGGDGSGSDADHPGQNLRALPPWPPTSVRSQSGAEFLRSPWFGPACDPVSRGTGMPVMVALRSASQAHRQGSGGMKMQAHPNARADNGLEPAVTMFAREEARVTTRSPSRMGHGP